MRSSITVPLSGSGHVVSSGLRAVVVALPLVAFPGLPGPYDQPKAWWLQVLVIVTGLAWLLEQAQGAVARSTEDADRPLIALRCLIAAYAAWWLVTTVTSVAPGQSLLGSFDRGFGLLTVLAGIALYSLVQASCGTAASRRSLIDIALLASVPVCLLALGQAVGWDRLPSTYDTETTALRVRSTMGQHLFLAGYLGMLIPLATVRSFFIGATAARISYGALGAGAAWVGAVLLLVRLASTVPLAWLLVPLWGVVAAVAWDRVGRSTISERVRGVPPAALFGALGALQVVVVILTGARGPFLGLIAALAMVSGMLPWRRQRVAGSAALKGALVVLICLGALLAAASSWRGDLHRIPIVARFAMPSGSEARDSVKDRLELWTAISGSLARQLAGTEVIPGQDPRFRNAVGYGLDTQALIVDPFVSGHRGVQRGRAGSHLVYDRAHDVLLDHVATGGLVAAAIWIALVAAIGLVGARRLRAGADDDRMIRLGCAGAVLVHVVDGVTGIETVVPFALFWILAAMLTAPLPRAAPESTPRPRYAPALWAGGLVLGAAIGCFTVAATTVWLLGSMSYVRGVALARIDRFAAARARLEYATGLVPWLPAPRSMAGEAALRVAALEADPARRAAILRETTMLLSTPYGGTAVSADIWLVRGLVALARARDGEAPQLAPALAAFARADRLRPHDIRILGPWAVGLLIDGRPAQARAVAERIIGLDEEDWMAWAIVARASARLGDQHREKEAEARAGRLMPGHDLPLFEQLR